MARENVEDSANLLFLLERTASTPPGRILRNVSGSLAVHALVVFVMLHLPDVSPPSRAPLIVADVRKSVKLVAPRYFDLTQKDPNQGKVSRSLDVRSVTTAPVRA